MVVSRADASVGRRAALGLLGLVLTCGSLVGCQSNPEPPPIEAASSSPSPSPSPADAPPTLPAEANGTSEAAAKAFVRHYIELVNYAMRTGDTGDLSSLSDPACGSCAEVVQNVDELYTDGGHLEGDGWEVKAIEAFPQGGPRTYTVQAAVLVSPQKRVSQPGERPERFQGGRKAMTLSIGPSAGGGWLVMSWSQTS
jgi:hypothetical protein